MGLCFSDPHVSKKTAGEATAMNHKRAYGRALTAGKSKAEEKLAEGKLVQWKRRVS